MHPANLIYIFLLLPVGLYIFFCLMSVFADDVFKAIANLIKYVREDRRKT